MDRSLLSPAVYQNSSERRDLKYDDWIRHWNSRLDLKLHHRRIRANIFSEGLWVMIIVSRSAKRSSGPMNRVSLAPDLSGPGHWLTGLFILNLPHLTSSSVPVLSDSDSSLHISDHSYIHNSSDSLFLNRKFTHDYDLLKMQGVSLRF